MFSTVCPDAFEGFSSPTEERIAFPSFEVNGNPVARPWRGPGF